MCTSTSIRSPRPLRVPGGAVRGATPAARDEPCDLPTAGVLA